MMPQNPLEASLAAGGSSALLSSASILPLVPGQAHVVDQAYRDYCARCEMGETIDPDAYCARFPEVESALAKLLQAHRFLEGLPNLRDGDDIAWPMVGDSFLDYQLLLQLGQGTFARVFLATETKLGNRLVAVKISREGAANEAAILGRIRHPNVVPVYSTARDPDTGLTLVCMPYLGSATLQSVRERTKQVRPNTARVILETARALVYPVDPSAHPAAPTPILETGTYLDGVCSLAAQLADALAYLHDLGVCHLDLKPSNVLLSPAGVPMLLDFNLSSNALRGQFLKGGTVPYMSPEQLRAVVFRETEENLTGPSDVYSLGVILFELVTGSHPFGPIPDNAATHDGATELLERQSHGLATPIRQINPAVDAGFARLIEGCLAFDAAKRPTASALNAALRRRLTTPARVRRWVGRNPRKTLASLVCSLALGVVALAGVALSPSPEQRHFDRGLEAYRKGDHDTAIAQFDAAIAANPRNSAQYYARGCAHLNSSLPPQIRYARASRDFAEAEKLAPHGRNLAAIGYCENCVGAHGAAAVMYRRAVDAGFATGDVYNNLGFSLSDPKEARKSLDKAIQIDPSLQPAYYNRAVLQMNVVSSNLKIVQDPQAVAVFPDAELQTIRAEFASSLQGGLMDIQKALDLGPPSGELSLTAACFFTAASSTDARWRKQALENLSRGVLTENCNSKSLANPLFETIQEETQFQALKSHPAPTASMTRAVRFVDPTRATLP